MKVVVVTGGSRGIGAAVVRRLAIEDWSVAVNYLGSSALAEELVGALLKEGCQAAAFQCDIASEEEVSVLFDTVERDLGPVTALVNNAGIAAPASMLAEIELSRWQSVLATNATGTFLCAREAVRRMSAGGRGGAIVNISSMAAVLGGGGEFIDYAASKAAVEAMTVGLAKEVGRQGIRVNAVRPGLIDTDMRYSDAGNDRFRDLVDNVPLGRVGQANDVAEAVAWLLSDKAAYVTGSTITVSGGR